MFLHKRWLNGTLTLLRAPALRRSIPLILLMAWAGCSENHPLGPRSSPPRVSFARLAAFNGTVPFPQNGAWSPTGKRLMYEHPLQSLEDELWVYDAARPAEDPQRVYVGDRIWLTCWSPDGQWVLCATNPAILNDSITLVAFRAVAGAIPHVLYSGTNVRWATWGANGMIYWWDSVTHERHRISPPQQWVPAPPGPYPDRTIIAFVNDPASQYGYRPHWFQTQPELEGWFDTQNPGQMGEITIVWDVFPNGQQFLVPLPTYCGLSTVVDRSGRVVTNLGSACDDPPFEGLAVSSDGTFVTGHSGPPSGYPSFAYCADAGGGWRVPIENTPDTVFWQALSKTDYGFAYTASQGESLFVGDLVFTRDTRQVAQR